MIPICRYMTYLNIKLQFETTLYADVGDITTCTYNMKQVPQAAAEHIINIYSYMLRQLS